MNRIFKTLACLGFVWLIMQMPDSCQAQSSADINKVRKIGAQAAEELAKTLKENLKQALEEGDPVAASAFCSRKATALTEQTQERMKQGMRIKRTSTWFRNPLNSPDGHEKKALEHFSRYLRKNGSLQSDFIQTLYDNRGVYFRYYKPLVVDGLCLTCHGSKVGMNPELKEFLKTRYPADRAIGYELGQLRGAIRVSIPKQLLENSEKE